jgi:hypothetical protein
MHFYAFNPTKVSRRKTLSKAKEEQSHIDNKVSFSLQYYIVAAASTSFSSLNYKLLL